MTEKMLEKCPVDTTFCFECEGFRECHVDLWKPPQHKLLKGAKLAQWQSVCSVCKRENIMNNREKTTCFQFDIRITKETSKSICVKPHWLVEYEKIDPHTVRRSAS